MTNPIRKIQTLFVDAVKALAGLGISERAVGMSAIFEQAYALIDQSDVWAYIMDIFHNDDGSMFAVVASEGKLYRVNLTLSGGEVSAAEWVEVVQEFVPTGRSLSIMRQADGKWRGFLISSTTVLNRVGEIDSTALHDSMNRRAADTGEYPYIDFFHLGPEWKMGQVDFLARDENVAIASFVFDDSPLARMMIRAYNDDPAYWGASISYYPTQEPEFVEIGDGDATVRIPVYTEGIYEAITLLPEQSAASLFTLLRSKKENQRMNNAVKEALKKLFGGDEQALEEFVTSIDSTNRSITERNLVRRDAAAEQTEDAAAEQDAVAGEGATSENEDPTAAPVAAAAADPATSEQEQEQEATEDHTVANVELDDEAVNAIVAALLENEGFTTTIAAALTPVLAEMRSLADRLAQYQAEQADATRRSADHDARLAALEADEDSKQRTWTADISRKNAREIKVTHRPRTPENTETSRPLSSSERANETLRKIGAA